MIFVFDTETTGLPRAYGTNLQFQPKCIEIYAGIYSREGEEVKRYHSLYNPGFSLEPVITKITGLRDIDLKNEQKFSKFEVNKLNNILEECSAVVAHNLSFDLEIMDFEAARLGEKHRFKWPDRKVCTVEQTMHLKLRRMKLVELYEYLFDKPLNQTHRAQDDVRALADCYFELLKREEI